MPSLMNDTTSYFYILFRQMRDNQRRNEPASRSNKVDDPVNRPRKVRR